MTSHLVQAIFTRTWRITLYVAGTRSRISETSSPSLCNVPPHAGHASSAGKCVCTSRGRCSGSGRRVDLALGVVSDAGACGDVLGLMRLKLFELQFQLLDLAATFSLFLPKIIRCSLAMTSLRCSISLSLLMRFSRSSINNASSISRDRETFKSATAG